MVAHGKGRGNKMNGGLKTRTEANSRCKYPDECSSGGDHGEGVCRNHLQGQLDDDGLRIPCSNAVVPHLFVCRSHGGGQAKSQALSYARSLVAEEQARVRSYGSKRIVTPAQALLEELYRTAGHVAWLGEKVAEIDAAALVWGTTEEHDRPESLGKDGENKNSIVTERKRRAVKNPWLVLYQEERKHLAEVSRMCLTSNIEERQTRVIEAQGKQLGQVLKLAMTDARLGITASAEVQSLVIRGALAQMELTAA